jgi:hypothetical protein
MSVSVADAIIFSISFYCYMFLKNHGNDPKVVQDLLRHASYQITTNIYDSATSDEKRAAHSGVIRLVTRASTRACQESGETATA